jgi:hypothetical protein
MGRYRAGLSMLSQHARQDREWPMRQRRGKLSRVHLSQCSRRITSQTSVLRALDPITPTYLFPAMNTFMYTHPLTAKQLKVVIDDLGYQVIGPQGSKGLACGDIGKSLPLLLG